jgi:hypothetical protein
MFEATLMLGRKALRKKNGGVAMAFDTLSSYKEGKPKIQN